MSKLDEWFTGRRWRLVTELDGEKSVQVTGGDGKPVPVAVTFSKGHFEIDPPGAFASPLGSRGRTGVLLQEVDGSGADIPGSLTAWGEATFIKARRTYGAIV